MKTKNLIDVKNLSVSFGNNIILNKINLHLSKKESLVIIGKSGSGKSVCINTIILSLPCFPYPTSANCQGSSCASALRVRRRDAIFVTQTANLTARTAANGVLRWFRIATVSWLRVRVCVMRISYF